VKVAELRAVVPTVAQRVAQLVAIPQAVEPWGLGPRAEASLVVEAAVVAQAEAPVAVARLLVEEALVVVLSEVGSLMVVVEPLVVSQAVAVVSISQVAIAVAVAVVAVVVLRRPQQPAPILVPKSAASY
jgi:hypothetical protein